MTPPIPRILAIAAVAVAAVGAGAAAARYSSSTPPSPSETRAAASDASARIVARGRRNATPAQRASAIARSPKSLPRLSKMPGWPVVGPHVVASNLNDPRSVAYHFGVDLWVDDRKPEPGAPTGLSHRVYALATGTARFSTPIARDCHERRLSVGAFHYWHVSPTVRRGAYVKAGDPIGWTCEHEWHVHVSEQESGVWVDPLRPGGALVPAPDHVPPTIGRIRFRTPKGARVPLGRVHGTIDVTAVVDDTSDPLPGVPRPVWHGPRLPRTVRVAVERGTTTVIARTLVAGARQIDARTTPFWSFYAAGTTATRPWLYCMARLRNPRCGPKLVLHLFARPFSLPTFDTTTLPNGDYRLVVSAVDENGNASHASVAFRVRNAARA